MPTAAAFIYGSATTRANNGFTDTPANTRLSETRMEAPMLDKQGNEQKSRRSMSLGTYPATSLADARKMAGLARTQIQQGLDPIDERRKTQEAENQADEPRWKRPPLSRQF